MVDTSVLKSNKKVEGCNGALSNLNGEYLNETDYRIYRRNRNRNPCKTLLIIEYYFNQKQ